MLKGAWASFPCRPEWLFVGDALALQRVGHGTLTVAEERAVWLRRGESRKRERRAQRAAA